MQAGLCPCHHIDGIFFFLKLQCVIYVYLFIEWTYTPGPHVLPTTKNTNAVFIWTQFYGDATGHFLSELVHLFLCLVFLLCLVLFFPMFGFFFLVSISFCFVVKGSDIV